MSTKRGVRVVLLVEDEALERFVRRVLLAFGFQTRDIRVKRVPERAGLGERLGHEELPREKSRPIEARPDTRRTLVSSSEPMPTI